VKGISIFLALAERFPKLNFAAVPTWGTTAEDRKALEVLPNMTILSARDDMDELLSLARVLLVPSVWAEARSRVVVEAMARGVPVLASNIGGIPEAKLGVPYLLPIHPVSRYETSVDENMVPIAEVPEQPVDAWSEALERITSDHAHWEEIANESRRAAMEYINRISVSPFESLIRALQYKPKRRAQKTRWSLAKQKLLALRLRQASEAKRNRWFPKSAAGRDSLRLFLFPYAGAGALTWRGWQEQLGDGFSVCPVQLPGRETRATEKPFENMAELIHELASQIEPLLDSRFVFFGHSMGAGIAFELTRELRRRGKAMPEALIVSAARAPQLRTTVSASLNDDELVERLQKLGGLPENPELLPRILPALRADTELYRHYMYSPDAPLDVPLIAYAGSDDPNVATSDVEAWSAQTNAEFRFATIEGGHFFIRSDEFIRRLREEILLAVSAPR
jgi:surfactin synthase thioesterase subunit